MIFAQRMYYNTDIQPGQWTENAHHVAIAAYDLSNVVYTTPVPENVEKGTKMEQEARKTDRRVQKTKRAIRCAFAELLAAKDIDDITVKDIADLADINRKTFYHHYSGIYQITEEIENEILSAFESALAGADFRQCLQNPYPIFEKLTVIVNSDMDFYGHLLNMKGNAGLTGKIIALLKAKAGEAFESQIKADSWLREMVTEYVISGMIAVYRNWFNSDRQRSVEELSYIIGTLCFSGIAGLAEGSSGWA